MIHTRARSRFYHEPTFKVGSPLRHKMATTPLRQPVKRRRLAISTLALNRTRSSSDTESDSGERPAAGREYSNGVSRAPLLPRRGGATRMRAKNLPKTPYRESPRKRKRSAGSYSPSASDGWVETEDEAGDLIDEDDQHLLNSAPVQTLQRLRKEELTRLWKVAGMWPDDDDISMDDPGASAVNQNMGKTELVNGILQFRKQSSLFSLSSPSTSSFGQPFTPRPSKAQTRSTRSTTGPSRPSSSDESQREVMYEATPRVKPRLRSRLHEQTSEVTPPRSTKGRLKTRTNHGKPRPKGTRHDNLRARFSAMVNVHDSPVKRLSRRSSNRSAQYITTSESDDGVEGEAGLRRSSVRHNDGLLTHSNVRATPLIRRLRPRNRGASFTSQASTEVEADAEDNGDEFIDSLSSSGYRSRTDSSSALRDRPDRRAKQLALQALRHGEDDEITANATEQSDGDAHHSSGSSYVNSVKSSKRASSTSSVHSQRSVDGLSDGIDIDSRDGVARTTRSGKTFGRMQQRVDELETLEDDSMDEDAHDGTEEWTPDSTLQEATKSALTRLRRDQLVQMCETRDLEMGGTKPQLVDALLEWRDERENRMERASSAGSQSTARAQSPQLMDAVCSNVHKPGQDTPVLMREHIHAVDPATPPRSEDDAAKASENDLNLDLQELGLEDFTIKPEFLQKLDKIGSGGFKDVFVGKLRGRKVAISEFREHLSEMDIRELKLLAEFRHPNIVRFRGICIPEDSSQVPCMLVSELCENGDLFDYIRNVEPPPLKRVLSLMLDIARGLEYLHLRNPAVIHRDCKSTNILITRNGVAKVGDFGLARVKHSTRSMIRSLVGTVNWQAPELWHPHPRYDYKVDVFSAALVYWEMLSGWSGEKKYPWEGHNEHYIYDAVGQKHKRPSLAGLRKHWGPEPVNLIERMWHQDPAERPTMTDVVADLEALLAEC